MPNRIAVVEDDPALGPMIETVLGLDGFDVTVVPDGKRAMDTIRSGRFDAVVLDFMLPGVDGIAIMKAIRANPSTATLPVIMLTAKTDGASTWAGWTAGCDYYMTKPFDPEHLINVIRKAVSGVPLG